MLSESILHFHRRLKIDSLLLNIKQNPFTHGLDQESVLNLQSLDHVNNMNNAVDKVEKEIN